jgi:hypothetical protein
VQPGKSNLVTFRFSGDEGIARQFAPSEEEFKKLHG